MKKMVRIINASMWKPWDGKTPYHGRPHLSLILDDPADGIYWEALGSLPDKRDGDYELVGRRFVRVG